MIAPLGNLGKYEFNQLGNLVGINRYIQIGPTPESLVSESFKQLRPDQKARLDTSRMAELALPQNIENVEQTLSVTY